MFALKLALVGASVLFASLASRRYGHGVAGTLAGLPMIAGPIMGFVLWQQTPGQARAIALATLQCLPAMVLHMVVFAHAARRASWFGAWLAANLAFLLAGALLSRGPLPAAYACTLPVLAVLAGLKAIPLPRPGAARRAGPVHVPTIELVLRVLVAMAIAAVVVHGAAWLPPLASGLLLAIPIVGNVLPCFTLPRHGADATVLLLRGFLFGLFGFAAFFVALVVALGQAGPGSAYLWAWLAALLVALGVYGWRGGGWRRLAQRAVREP